MISKIYKLNESEKLNATQSMMINTAKSCIGTMKILKNNQHMTKMKSMNYQNLDNNLYIMP